jgi:hypothetical protein
VLTEVKGGSGEDRAKFRENGGRKSDRSSYKGLKSEGNFGKSAARQKFSRKIFPKNFVD